MVYTWKNTANVLQFLECMDCSWLLALTEICVFGTYLQSGVCVLNCGSGRIADSAKRECRDVQGKLIGLVLSITYLIVCVRPVFHYT